MRVLRRRRRGGAGRSRVDRAQRRARRVRGPGDGRPERRVGRRDRGVHRAVRRGGALAVRASTRRPGADPEAGSRTDVAARSRADGRSRIDGSAALRRSRTVTPRCRPVVAATAATPASASARIHATPPNPMSSASVANPSSPTPSTSWACTVGAGTVVRGPGRRGAIQRSKSRCSGLPRRSDRGADPEHDGEHGHDPDHAGTRTPPSSDHRRSRPARPGRPATSTGIGPSSHGGAPYGVTPVPARARPSHRVPDALFPGSVSRSLRCVFSCRQLGGDSALQDRPVATRQSAAALASERPARRTPTAVQTGDMDLGDLAQNKVVRGADVDVARIRERTRRRRLWKLFLCLAPIGVYVLLPDRDLRTRSGSACRSITPTQMQIFLPVGLIVAARRRARRADDGGRASRRTCATTRARSTSTLDDVVGLGPVQGRGRQDPQPVPRLPDVPRAHGRQPAQGRCCSKVRPAPARRTWPRRWRARPACPFLFVSSTAFQSSTTAQTGRKIRNYFKELRKAAREEGGAIGFIEEIDAIAGARSGMRSRRRTPRSASTRDGTVAGRAQLERGHLRRRQRAADPDAVVRHADGGHAFTGWWIDSLNRFLPAHRRIKKQPPMPVEHPA